MQFECNLPIRKPMKAILGGVAVLMSVPLAAQLTTTVPATQEAAGSTFPAGKSAAAAEGTAPAPTGEVPVTARGSAWLTVKRWTPDSTNASTFERAGSTFERPGSTFSRPESTTPTAPPEEEIKSYELHGVIAKSGVNPARNIWSFLNPIFYRQGSGEVNAIEWPPGTQIRAGAAPVSVAPLRGSQPGLVSIYSEIDVRPGDMKYEFPPGAKLRAATAPQTAGSR